MAGLKLTSLKHDLKAEEDGIWIDAPGLPGVRFKVSSIHRESYQTGIDLMMSRLARQYRGGAVPEAERVAERGKLIAEHLLHGWEGFNVPYDPDTARACLVDPAYRDLTKSVTDAATLVGLPDLEYDEVEKEGSSPSSAGT